MDTRCGVSGFGGRQGRDAGPWGLDGGQAVQGRTLVADERVRVGVHRQDQARVPHRFGRERRVCLDRFMQSVESLFGKIRVRSRH